MRWLAVASLAVARAQQFQPLAPHSTLGEHLTRVQFEVMLPQGPASFEVEVDSTWAPTGAARFLELVEGGFYDQCRFFRVIEGFMAQFGINGNPEIAKAWRSKTIPDDPVRQSNKRGLMSFAMTSAPNSRTTQLFINYADNHFLDKSGFAPFAKVVEPGMKVVEKIFPVGEGAPHGPGPSQGRIQTEGNAYLSREYPQLSYIIRAKVLPRH